MSLLANSLTRHAMTVAGLCLLSFGAHAAEWRLAGTLLGNQNASAIVEDDGLQRRVEAGDSLDDCQVARIGSDHVLLVCVDGEKRLRLNGDPSKSFDVNDVADTRYAAIDRQALKTLTTDRQHLVSQIDLAPKIGANGRVAGWRIESIAEGGELAQLGLRSGDVIVAVNQIAVEDSQFMASISNAGDQGLINISLQRDQQPLELSYTLH